MLLLLGFAFVAGILTILAPCTLPIVPVVLGAAGARGARIAGVFIGFAVTFVAVTVIVASLLASVGISTGGLRIIAAAALGIVGLSLAFPRFGASLARRLQLLDPRPRPLSTGGGSGFGVGLAIGASIGIVWAPCVGPIMAAVIAAAAVTGPSPLAVLVASAYVLGAIIPLAIIALWGRRLTTASRGIAGRSGIARRWFGASMAVAALVVLTGLDVSIAGRISGLITPGVLSDFAAIERLPAVEEELQVLRPTNAPANDAVPLEDFGQAPEFTGISDWINSSPLTMSELRGKVVLVEFWTFACSNCRAVQPYVVAWDKRYAADGLVVVAVHTPELSFERDLNNVRAAVEDAGLRYPIAVDPKFATWNAYGNRYWPAFYFVDKRGDIRHVHFGEGDYDGSEAVIRQLLNEPA